MNAGLTIADSDNHRLWVFALNMTPDEIVALADPAVAALLGVAALDRAFVEIFDVDDLTGLGLASYLAVSYTHLDVYKRQVLIYSSD